VLAMTGSLRGGGHFDPDQRGDERGPSLGLAGRQQPHSPHHPAQQPYADNVRLDLGNEIEVKISAKPAAVGENMLLVI